MTPEEYKNYSGKWDAVYGAAVVHYANTGQVGWPLVIKLATDMANEALKEDAKFWRSQ
jgi:hypothetical protein